MRTMALAGSAPRGDSSIEDDKYGRELLGNTKEQQEHNFVIRQIKNNLDTITSTLEISPEPNLMRLRNIQHIRTDITGGLKSDHNVLNVVEALHPTPAVGGNPRPKALEDDYRTGTAKPRLVCCAYWLGWMPMAMANSLSVCVPELAKIMKLYSIAGLAFWAHLTLSVNGMKLSVSSDRC